MRNNAVMRARSFRSNWSQRQWQNLGNQVYERRVERGFSSQEALADAAGVGTRTIAALEGGEGVGRATLQHVEDTLGWLRGSCVTILSGGIPTPVDLDEHTPDTDDDLPEDPLHREAVLAIRALQLTQRDESIVLAMIEQFTGPVPDPGTPESDQNVTRRRRPS